jgi:hypothetical protein
MYLDHPILIRDNSVLPKKIISLNWFILTLTEAELQPSHALKEGRTALPNDKP